MGAEDKLDLTPLEPLEVFKLPKLQVRCFCKIKGKGFIALEYKVK